jgi:hypothetical protein
MAVGSQVCRAGLKTERVANLIAGRCLAVSGTRGCSLIVLASARHFPAASHPPCGIGLCIYRRYIGCSLLDVGSDPSSVTRAVVAAYGTEAGVAGGVWVSSVLPLV